MPQPLLNLGVLNRIARRLRQARRFKAALHLPHMLLTEPARLKKFPDLFHGGREVVQAWQPSRGFKRFRYEVFRISREKFDEARRVNLRVAGLDRWIVADQRFRRLRRHLHSF